MIQKKYRYDKGFEFAFLLFDLIWKKKYDKYSIFILFIIFKNQNIKIQKINIIQIINLSI